MFCPVCNTQFDDENAKYCPNCNENIKIAEQRIKVNEGIAKTGDILREIFRSKKFLTYCVILSVICGLYAFAFLDSLPTLNISAGLYIGFGVATLVAAWKLYASCAQNKAEKQLISQMKLLPTYMHIMSSIVFVLMIIASAAILLGFFALLGAMNQVDSISDAVREAFAEMEAQGVIVFEGDFTPDMFFKILSFVEEHIILIMIVAFILMAGITVFYYFEKKAYKSQKLFFENLEAMAVTSVYMTPAMFSPKLLMVVGIIDIVIAAPAVGFAVAGNIASVMLGVFMIITSRLFKEINEKLEENGKYVSEQRKILDNMMFEERMYQQNNQESNQ